MQLCLIDQKNSERSKNNELLLREAEAKKAYYEEVEKSNVEIQRTRHDLKNRLLGIVAKQSGEEIRSTIYQMIDEMEHTQHTIHTPNTIVNTVLNNKPPLNKESCRRENGEKHRGYGLKSVQNIVEKYEGTMEIVESKDSFAVDVLLYGVIEIV